MLFRLGLFFVMTSIVVLDTQMQMIKLRSSKLIININAPKQMVESSFAHRFHDLTHFEVGILFHSP